ncbi:MAG: UDP-N-acetylmuramoyl-tripeptide--D-alanyl-D-alanine ligase [Actinomycetota bacterium]
MIVLTLDEIARLVKGHVVGEIGNISVAGPVVTDARECGLGSLFVARVGQRSDGLDFVFQARERGAVAVLASRPAVGLPTVVVADVQAALAALARGVVDRLTAATVIGITGSSGKTSTKDVLAHILSNDAPTVATEKSYNGEVGVPLTVLRAEGATRYVVAEMGARGIGHISYLAKIAPPRIGVVLNVGSAHLGEFGSREAIAEAKSELVQALPPDGVAVLNIDDPLVRAMAQYTAAQVCWFGESSEAHVQATNVRLDDQARATFTLSIGAERAEVSLRLHGAHHVSNALAASAVAHQVGMSVPRIAAALREMTSVSRWRMEVTDRPGGVRIVNDAYNANPESMRAALKALREMAFGRGRAWAVLGPMRELGAASVAEHDAVGRLAVRLDIEHVVAVGPDARAIHTGAVQEGSWGGESCWVFDADAAYQTIVEGAQPGDVVLIKASRDAGLEVLGERLAGGAFSQGGDHS